MAPAAERDLLVMTCARMNALAGTLPRERALSTYAAPIGELASTGVSLFVDSDGRVPASVIYSTVVPVGVRPG
jgi:hypothetical protein